MTTCVRDLIRGLHSDKDAWLLLFDIDGTLIDAGRIGLRALQCAAEQVFKGKCPPLDLAGATDLGILHDFYDHFGLSSCSEKPERFFDVYHEHLANYFLQAPQEGMILEGAVPTLDQFKNWKNIELALLTGNTEPGAFIKLKHFGIDTYFSFGAFGSDHADRNQLGAFAKTRALTHTGNAYPTERILVIGDTPKDIACAHAMGARCIAVATGKFSKKQLIDSRADWVIESLEELIL